MFVPDGRVVISYFNVPGNVHDSQIAYLGRIYDKLEGVFFNCGGQCVGDSAFAHTQKEFIIRSGKFIRGLELHHEINRLIGNGDWEAVNQIALNVQATSMRQASEWGMRALKASFPRLVDTIFYEDYGERKHIMKMAILLYNLRATRVGINQIKNTYMPRLEEPADGMFPQWNDAPPLPAADNNN